MKFKNILFPTKTICLLKQIDQCSFYLFQISVYHDVERRRFPRLAARRIEKVNYN